MRFDDNLHKQGTAKCINETDRNGMKLSALSQPQMYKNQPQTYK